MSFLSDVLNVDVECKICLLHQSSAAKLHLSEREVLCAKVAKAVDYFSFHPKSNSVIS